jgi:endonuclease/exonuclease/phosphatase family metal-dependent hydrolase
MNLVYIYIVLSISFGTIAEGLEHSVVPLVEQTENLASLNPKKYAKRQFSQIQAALEQKEEKVRLVTFNMLFNLYDSKMEPHYRWPARLERIVEVIVEMQPDLISTQELVLSQLEELGARLGVKYAYFSPANHDRTTNTIFYKRDRFALEQAKAHVMTEESEDLLSNALNVVELRDLKTNKSFALMNTHTCFRSVDLREAQALFIAQEAKETTERMPVVVTGDFNTFPNRADETDLPFYDGDYVQKIITSEALHDAKEMSLLGHLGPIATFTNAPGSKAPFQGTGSPGIFLDHIFVSKGIQVLIHAVQPATSNGLFPSDHMPVLIDFLVE